MSEMPSLDQLSFKRREKDHKKRCKAFLLAYRKVISAKPEEKIDKRYKPYLAPNDKYYDTHCGYCAEVKYLEEIYHTKILIETTDACEYDYNEKQCFATGCEQYGTCNFTRN